MYKRQTLAELAFPLTAALIGVLATVVALALHEARASRPAVTEAPRDGIPEPVGR